MSPTDRPKTPSKSPFADFSYDYSEPTVIVPAALLAAIVAMMGGSITLTREDIEHGLMLYADGNINLYQQRDPDLVVLKLEGR
jgi:hypothetical protein